MCTGAWCSTKRSISKAPHQNRGEGRWKARTRNWAVQIDPAEPHFISCPLQGAQVLLALDHEPLDVAVTRALGCSITAPGPSSSAANLWQGLAPHSFQGSNILDHTSGERGNCQPSKLLFGLLFVPLWELNFRSYHGKGWHDQVKTPHPRGDCRSTIYINKLIPCSWGWSTEQPLLLQETIDFWWSSVEKKTYFIPK